MFCRENGESFVRADQSRIEQSFVEMKGEVVRTKKDDDFPDS